MSDAEDNPFLIASPPGVPVPKIPARSEASGAVEEAEAAPESFISLPPGVADSGTYRVANPRVVPPPAPKHRDDIVFFPASPGVPAQAPTLVHDDNDLEETRAARAIPRQWRLVLPEDAGTLSVGGATLLGRNPACTAERPEAELLLLMDSAKTLSKTHAMLEIDGEQLWVHDLDSTNGVFVISADGDAIEVTPGTRSLVPANADLELGEYVIRVEYR